MKNISLNKRIGKNVKELRNKRSLTQQQLANMSNLHRNYICNLEKGIVNPSLASLKKISTALDVEIKEVIKD